MFKAEKKWDSSLVEKWDGGARAPSCPQCSYVSVSKLHAKCVCESYAVINHKTMVVSFVYFQLLALLISGSR